MKSPNYPTGSAKVEAKDGGLSGRRPRMAGGILRRPEAGGAISAILVFAFFAILAGNSGFLSPLGTAYWFDTASELGIIAVPVGMGSCQNRSATPAIGIIKMLEQSS